MNRDNSQRLDSPGFNRVLKNREVITLGFGAMIGWSWVLTTGTWVEQAGSLGTLIAFAAGGLVIALIGLTYSELVSAMPRAGGEHVYTHRGLGPNWSFICTWSLLLAYLNVCLFEAVALPTAMEELLPGIRIGTLWNLFGYDVDLGFVLIGTGGSMVITLVNVLGIRAAAWFQTGAFILIVFAGVLLMAGAISFGEARHAQPWIGVPVSGILSVLIMIPALLVGFDVIPQSAEEINLPPARIGMLLVVSVVMAVLWYAVITLSVAVSMPREELLAGGLATSNAAAALWSHPMAGSMLILGGIAGILTSWNAFVIGASRLLYALAESGMVPAIFARLHPKFKTPYVGILFIGTLCCLAPLFGRTVLLWLINAGGFATIVAYIFVPIAFLALRRKEPDMPRPFKVSHPKLVGFSAVILAFAMILNYLPGSPAALIWPYEWATITTWSVLGVVIFLIYRAGAR